LLEGIGVLKRDKKSNENYQDSVTAPVDRSFDDDAIGQEDEDEEGDEGDSRLLRVLSAIEKLIIFSNGLISYIS
jgi:hypothetical protein